MRMHPHMRMHIQCTHGSLHCVSCRSREDGQAVLRLAHGAVGVDDGARAVEFERVRVGAHGLVVLVCLEVLVSLILEVERASLALWVASFEGKYDVVGKLVDGD